MSRPEWFSEAECRPGNIPEWQRHYFYNAKGVEEIAIRTICSRCKVRTDCMVEALTQREEWGVWGGKTAKERAFLLKTQTTENEEKQAPPLLTSDDD